MKRIQDEIENSQSNRCCICEQICESHNCLSCGKKCHPFCGKLVGEEGYGAKVLCGKCEKGEGFQEEQIENSATAKDKPDTKKKKPEGKQKTLHALLGQKEPIPAKKFRKNTSERKVFCLLCARSVEESGKEVVQGKEMYLICRPDRTSKNRHVQRNHKDIKVKDDGHYSFLVDPSHKEAIQISKNIDVVTTPSEVKQSSNPSSKPIPVLAQTTVKPILPAPFEEDEPESSDLHMENPLLHSMDKKLDALTRAVDKISLQATSANRKEKEQKNIEIGPLLAIGQKNFEEALPLVNEWSNVGNIYDVTQLFPVLRLFPGTQDGQISVFRCDVCYRFLTKDPFSPLDNQKEAFATANAGIGR